MTRDGAFVHRALFAAVVHGLMPADAPLVVVNDDASIEGDALVRALEARRVALGDDGVMAIVAASPAAAALIAAAAASKLASGDTAPAAPGRAWSAALAWSSARARASVGSPLSLSRLRMLAAATDAAGLALVVPDVALVSPPLAEVASTRFQRTPIARAAVHLYARGALAFPLLFVPRARAPKNGLPKTRLDRITDGWVAASSAVPAPSSSSLTPLVASAMATLADAGAPLPFKELLRAARERQGDAATDDGKQLTAALYRLWSVDAVDLLTTDPRRPSPLASNIETL